METTFGSVKSTRAAVVRHVASRVRRLQGGIVGDAQSPGAACKLAVLRRAAGEAPGATPEAYGIETEEMPGGLFGKGEAPSYEEWAVHVALTLYAVHQQAQPSGMHAAGGDGGPGQGIGHAVKKLRVRQVSDRPSEDVQVDIGEMPTRFAAMVKAETVEGVAHYARQIVQQLRSESIPLDYARFAGQVYQFQVPGCADGVRLEWGREYAHRIPAEEKDAAEGQDK